MNPITTSNRTFEPNIQTEGQKIGRASFVNLHLGR